MKFGTLSLRQVAVLAALTAGLLLMISIFVLDPLNVLEAHNGALNNEQDPQAWLGPWGFWLRDWGGLMRGYSSVSYA